MQFITVEHPGQAVSTSLKRQAHSHAARVAHARARKLRVAMLQNGTAGGGSSQPVARQSTPTAGMRRQYEPASQDETVFILPRSIDSALERETFTTFRRSLTPREHYLFNHYIQVVVPYINVHCPVMKQLGKHHEYIRQNWISYSSTEVELLKGFLLAACRHLSMVHSQEEYAQLAIEYKLQNIQSLRETLSTENPSSSRKAVAIALVLAYDEIMVGDLSMASKHILGAAKIVELAGGIQVLGLSEVVYYILYSCIFRERLFSWTPIVCGTTFMKSEPAQALQTRFS